MLPAGWVVPAARRSLPRSEMCFTWNIGVAVRPETANLGSAAGSEYPGTLGSLAAPEGHVLSPASWGVAGHGPGVGGRASEPVQGPHDASSTGGRWRVSMLGTTEVAATPGDGERHPAHMNVSRETRRAQCAPAGQIFGRALGIAVEPRGGHGMFHVKRRYLTDAAVAC